MFQKPSITWIILIQIIKDETKRWNGVFRRQLATTVNYSRKHFKKLWQMKSRFELLTILLTNFSTFFLPKKSWTVCSCQRQRCCVLEESLDFYRPSVESSVMTMMIMHASIVLAIFLHLASNFRIKNSSSRTRFQPRNAEEKWILFSIFSSFILEENKWRDCCVPLNWD